MTNPTYIPGHKNGKRRNRGTVKFPWRWLVVPEYNGICGLHTAVAFEVFRYLAETGAGCRQAPGCLNDRTLF